MGFFVFHTHRIWFGENFVYWDKLLYHNLLGPVITDSKCSLYFALGRGKWQGCPLLPFLFANAMELVADALRIHPSIHVYQ